MNEDYAESELDFSGMSDDELLEIVSSGSGDYSQEAVDGANNELKCRKDGTARIERPRRVVKPETDPPVLPATVPGSKLFSVGQITLATFLGTPIAGCLLLAQNYRALGKDSAALQSLVLGIASTILLIAIGFCLPDSVPGTGVAIGTCMGMRQVVIQFQGGAIDNHLKAGGRKGSWWMAVALGISCSVIIFGLVVAIVLLFFQ